MEQEIQIIVTDPVPGSWILVTDIWTDSLHKFWLNLERAKFRALNSLGEADFKALNNKMKKTDVTEQSKKSQSNI